MGTVTSGLLRKLWVTWKDRWSGKILIENRGGLKNKTVSSVIIGMKDGVYKPLAVDDCR